jgi:hypothetical protein
MDKVPVASKPQGFSPNDKVRVTIRKSLDGLDNSNTGEVLQIHQGRGFPSKSLDAPTSALNETCGSLSAGIETMGCEFSTLFLIDEKLVHKTPMEVERANPKMQKTDANLTNCQSLFKSLFIYLLLPHCCFGPTSSL